MSLPQHIIYEVGGTVSIDVEDRPTTAYVTIKNGDGSTIVDNVAASISTITTTLSSAVTVGSRTITVSNATGISDGKEFWLRNPSEKVRCKNINGTSVTLWRPVLSSHDNASNVQGTLITYAVSASNASTLFWDGRVSWVLDNSLYAYTAVECTRYPLVRIATEQDLYDEFPDLDQMLSESDDVDALLNIAHEEVMSRIGGRTRVRTRPGSTEFKKATVFSFASALFRRRPGESADQLYKRYREELNNEITRIMETVPVDADQDGSIDQDDKRSSRTVQLFRA